MKYKIRFHKKKLNGEVGKTSVSVDIDTHLSLADVKKNVDGVLSAAFYQKRKEDERLEDWELTNIEKL